MSADTLNTIFERSVRLYGEKPALKFRQKQGISVLTYRELGHRVQVLGAGFLSLGVRQGERVGLIAENRPEWLLTDLALLGCGVVDVPRGGEASLSELQYILAHSEAVGAVVEDRHQLEKIEAIRSDLPRLRFLVVMDPVENPRSPLPVYTLAEVMEQGRERLVAGRNRFLERSHQVRAGDLATIIYTSGTTGTPRGVMLSHANIVHNVRTLPPLLQITSADRFLSILPPWHAFERTVEYILLSTGASLFYSKPVKQILLPDLQTEKPTFLAGVPRIWQGLYKGIMTNIAKERAPKRWLVTTALAVGHRHRQAERERKGLLPLFTPLPPLRHRWRRARATLTYGLTKPLYALFDRMVYSKIRQVTGGKLRAVISGGGALPRPVDDFFSAVGITILEGYGLTETAPVVSVRLFGQEIPYTVGTLLPETFVKILDEEGKPVRPGEQGIIWIRGPQVMLGYYKDKEATERAIDAEGWLNSGDLGRLTLQGALQITGRAKDTIVLLSGENVEPEPLEMRLSESPYIHQVMVVGQDQRMLGALIVPDFPALETYLQKQGVSPASVEEMLRSPPVQELYRKEIHRLISSRNGFRACERIGGFVLLPREFRVGQELTHTLKMKRNVITQQFAQEIAQIYHSP
ncbi:MAG: long-chain fatty acid--CoA ligase [Nitrospinota bacterium]|nr:MAG: long-chain fatty acid--CoA ligase [Nitrospinota bacterium]